MRLDDRWYARYLRPRAERMFARLLEATGYAVSAVGSAAPYGLRHLRGWEAIPITLNQERTLLSEEAAGILRIAAPSFHLTLALEIDQPQVPVLTRALQLVVQRQGALRASFVASGNIRSGKSIERLLNEGVIEPGLYQQRLHATATLPLEVRSLGPNDGEQAVVDIVREASLRPFERTRAPLARVVLIERRSGPCLLLVVVHHLIGDRESLRLLHHDLEESYACLVHGDTESWSQRSLPYGQALAQLKAADDRDRQIAIDYWLRQWRAHESSQLQPSDFRFTPAIGETARLGQERVIVDEAGLRQIRRLARASRLTPAMIYLAAFAILLAKYTSRDSVGIWSHIDNRWRTNVDGVMAWFVHTHLLGIRVDTSASGLQLLDDVRRVVLEAIKHGHVPLAELWRQTGRSWERRFRVQFTLNGGQPPAGGKGGAVMRRVAVPGGGYRGRGFELSATERQGFVAFEAKYMDTHFTSMAVHHMLASYVTTLDHLVRDPGATVSTM